MSESKLRQRPAAVTLTPAAEARIAALMAKAPEGTVGVKLSTPRRGCSGLAYSVDYVSEAQPFDEHPGQVHHPRVEAEDVERQPIEEEPDGEPVVHEDRRDVVLQPEGLREVQRRLQDEDVDDGGEPDPEPDRVAAAQRRDRVGQGQHGEPDEDDLDEGHRAVGEVARVADVADRARPFAGDPAECLRELAEPLGAEVAHHTAVRRRARRRRAASRSQRGLHEVLAAPALAALLILSRAGT